jgi:hypothetical protein
MAPGADKPGPEASPFAAAPADKPEPEPSVLPARQAEFPSLELPPTTTDDIPAVVPAPRVDAPVPVQPVAKEEPVLKKVLPAGDDQPVDVKPVRNAKEDEAAAIDLPAHRKDELLSVRPVGGLQRPAEEAPERRRPIQRKSSAWPVILIVGGVGLVLLLCVVCGVGALAVPFTYRTRSDSLDMRAAKNEAALKAADGAVTPDAMVMEHVAPGRAERIVFEPGNPQTQRKVALAQGIPRTYDFKAKANTLYRLTISAPLDVDVKVARSGGPVKVTPYGEGVSAFRTTQVDDYTIYLKSNHASQAGTFILRDCSPEPPTSIQPGTQNNQIKVVFDADAYNPETRMITRRYQINASDSNRYEIKLDGPQGIQLLVEDPNGARQKIDPDSKVLTLDQPRNGTYTLTLDCPHSRAGSCTLSVRELKREK